MSAGTKGPVVNIYIYLFMLFISCRYANPDFDRLRTNRTRLNIYRERRNLCQATGANPVSPKLFGSCFVCEDVYDVHVSYHIMFDLKIG